MNQRETASFNRHKKVCATKKWVKWKCNCKTTPPAEDEILYGIDGEYGECEYHYYNRQCPKCKHIFRV